MIRNVEAVYEGGVLRPLAPLDLSESQRVSLVVSTTPETQGYRDFDIMRRAAAEALEMGITPTIEEVRAALSVIPGSMARDIIEDRGEY